MGLVITIGRSYGSGGRTMGKLLAEELGLKYYDRELVRMASDKSGISEALFGAADEFVKVTPLFKMKRKDFGDVPFTADNGEFASNDNLYRFQAQVIKEVAKEGDCVIIGRCANHVLKDDPNVIRLFCYAPLKDCIAREKALSGLDDKDIIKKIEKIDKVRADYYRYYTGGEWNDADNYDLCINTASMSYEQLLKVVKTYIEEYRNK